MKIKKLSVVLIVFFSLFTKTVIFPQHEMENVKLTDAGTFSGSLNGSEFSNPIRYSEAEDLVTIATGDKNFTLTLNCKDVSTISQLKEGTYQLPNDKSITVLYLDNNAAVPFIITKGNLKIAKNNSNELKGTLDFTASAGGIPKEMGGTETILSNGKFEIAKDK